MASTKSKEGPSTTIFFVLTGVYLVTVLIGAWKLGYFDIEGTPLHPNEWGDVLAGVFSPLAFLWLIYASLSQRAELSMQREELSQNNQTQDAQRGEMERQASALNAQIRRLEAEANAKYEPIIVLNGRYFRRAEDTGVVDITLENVGGTALSIIFDSSVVATSAQEPGTPYGRDIRTSFSHWKKGEIVEISSSDFVSYSEDFDLIIHMNRLDGVHLTHTYRIMNHFSSMMLIERNDHSE